MSTQAAALKDAEEDEERAALIAWLYGPHRESDFITVDSALFNLLDLATMPDAERDRLLRGEP